jgi:diguanylate cyclase (GGDEF)-like protein
VDVPDATAASLAAVGFDTARVDAAAFDGVRQRDAVLWHAPRRSDLRQLCKRADLVQAATDAALVVLAGECDDRAEIDLLRLGVQAIVMQSEGGTRHLARAIHHASMRKQVELAARRAYATDLGTGLPHQAQLLEHMTQLLALREREPAPMVLLVLRIEGFAQVSVRLGEDAAQALRRKVAVRVRSALRAGDVVASIGGDAFGVLLGHLEAAQDGQRVAGKLVRALEQPLQVAGQACRVAVAVGMALYPEHGRDAQQLLQRASAQAGTLATLGRQDLAARLAAGGAAAANDEAP